MNNKNGFSIIELMVATTLSLLLLTALTEIYLGSKKNYQEQLAIARLQENGRLATFILSKNIRTTGYTGCLAGRLNDAIRGYNSSNAPSYVRNKVKSSTDVIIIKKADTNITHLAADVTKYSSSIKVTGSNPATTSDHQLLIADCLHSELITANNDSGKTIMTNSKLKYDYQTADTELAQYTEIAYFISKTSYKDATGQPVYALYESINQGNKQELVDNIQNMRIEYGMNSNYYPANAITTWNKVRSVYIVLDLTINNLHKEWPIYIALRERIQ